MAAEYDTIFYEVNVLHDIGTWKTDSPSLAYVNRDPDTSELRYTISPEGYIYLQLDDVLVLKALKASKYRKVIIGIKDENIDERFNYQNLVELTQEIVYTDANSNKTWCTNTTPFVMYDSVIKDNNIREVVTDISMLNQDLESDLLTVRNNSDHEINVYYIKMYRSNDLTGQLEDVGEGEEGPEPGEITQLTMEFSKNTLDTIDDIMTITVECPVSYASGGLTPLSGGNMNIDIIEGYENARVARPFNEEYTRVPSGYRVKMYVRGVRNGIVNCRYTLGSAGTVSEHLGEFVEKQLTIINCDPGTLELSYEGANKVNGFGGTPVEIQMMPHKWYTSYSSVINTTDWGGSARVGNLGIYVGMRIGEDNNPNVYSIDGGTASLNDKSYKYNSIIDMSSSNTTIFIYGVWNGRLAAKLDALSSGSLAGYSVNIVRTVEEVIEVINCEHTIEIDSVEDILSNTEDRIEVYLKSNPAGVPYIRINHGWQASNSIRLNEYGNLTSRPYVIASIKDSSIVDGRYSVTCLAETSYNQYSNLEKYLIVNTGISNEYYIQLVNMDGTGSNKISTLGGKAVFQIVYNLPSGTKRWSIKQISNNGGYVIASQSSTTSNIVNVTGVWDGEITLVITDLNTSISGTYNIVVENNNSYKYKLVSNISGDNTIIPEDDPVLYLQGINEDGTENEADKMLKYFNYVYNPVNLTGTFSFNSPSLTFPNNRVNVDTSTNTAGTFYVACKNPASDEIIVEETFSVSAENQYYVKLNNIDPNSDNTITSIGQELVFNISANVNYTGTKAYSAAQTTQNGGYAIVTVTANQVKVKGIWDGDIVIVLTETHSNVNSSAIRIKIQGLNSSSYKIGCNQFTAENVVPIGKTGIVLYLQGINEDGTENELDRQVKYFNRNYQVTSGSSPYGWNSPSVTFPNVLMNMVTVNTGTGIFYVAFTHPITGLIIAEANITMKN